MKNFTSKLSNAKYITVIMLLFSFCMAYSQNQTKISIHNINLNIRTGRGEPVEGYARRLDNIAKLFLQTISSHNLSWDLIGFNEAFALYKKGYFYYAQRIPCVKTNNLQFTPHCFVASLRNPPYPLDISYQVGEVGISAREEKFVNKDLFHANIGYQLGGPFHLTQRDVVGMRILIKDQGYILPLFSTHISPQENSKVRRKQLNDLVKAIKNWWKPGDLTPVIAGDFNSHYWNNDDWEIMRRDFEEVGASFGHDVIEHIWIGKESSFPGSLGSMTAVRYEALDEFNDGGQDLTDHRITYAELVTPPETCMWFNPTNLRVGPFWNWWVIHDAPNLTLILPWFFGNKDAAEKALNIIRYYGMNQVCAVENFKNLLISDNAPIGRMWDEDCNWFGYTSPTVIYDDKISEEYGQWRIVYSLPSGGTAGLANFKNEGAAWRALSIMKKYHFIYECYNTRPTNFVYYRR